MTQASTLNDTLEFGLFDWIEWDKSAPARDIREPPEDAGVRRPQRISQLPLG